MRLFLLPQYLLLCLLVWVNLVAPVSVQANDSQCPPGGSPRIIRKLHEIAVRVLQVTNGIEVRHRPEDGDTPNPLPQYNPGSGRDIAGPADLRYAIDDFTYSEFSQYVDRHSAVPNAAGQPIPVSELNIDPSRFFTPSRAGADAYLQEQNGRPENPQFQRDSREESGGMNEIYFISSSDGALRQVVRIQRQFDEGPALNIEMSRRELWARGGALFMAEHARYGGRPFMRVVDNHSRAEDIERGVSRTTQVEGGYSLAKLVNLIRRNPNSPRLADQLSDLGYTVDEVLSYAAAAAQAYRDMHPFMLRYFEQHGVRPAANSVFDEVTGERVSEGWSPSTIVGIDFNHGENVFLIPRSRARDGRVLVIIDQ